MVFRKFNNGEVIALIQDNLSNFGMIDSYMHIGQHSESCINIINDTTIANKSEYKDLLNELKMIGII